MTRNVSTLYLAALLGVGIFGQVASAQSMPERMGEFEYMNSCAACHGADGKGDGSIAGFLNTALPDLTQLKAKNDGFFPVSKVYGIIEGGPDAGPHGTRDMPAWGTRYRIRADNDPDFIFDSDEYARFRILALIEYLSTIQTE